MNRDQSLVSWSLPRWAAELILETLKLDSESTAFDPRLRKLLAAALSVITEGKSVPASPGAGFDLFRLSKSKQVVDVCPNTLRAYHQQGLPFYHQGKAIFISKTELIAFLRTHTRSGKGSSTEQK